MAKFVVTICDNADEQARAHGYWKNEGYELLTDEVKEVNRVSVFEENSGQQPLWSQRFDSGKGVRALVYVKK